MHLLVLNKLNPIVEGFHFDAQCVCLAPHRPHHQWMLILVLPLLESVIVEYLLGDTLAIWVDLSKIIDFLITYDCK